jgi:hypothetical protein
MRWVFAIFDEQKTMKIVKLIADALDWAWVFAMILI